MHSKGLIRLFCLMPIYQTDKVKVRIRRMTVLYSSLVFATDTLCTELAKIHRPIKIEWA